MALAGAQLLCAKAACEEDAINTAEAYGPLNGLAGTEIESVTVGVDCDGTTYNNHDTITVRTRRTKASFIAYIVGVDEANIKACATARKYAVGGFTGVVPFGMEEQCLGAATPGTTYTLKYDSDTGSSANCDAGKGNFGALAVDTSGAGSGCGSFSNSEEKKFKEALCFGASRGLCAIGVTGCLGQADNDSCTSTKPSATQSYTETGNMTGSIKEGIEYRFTNTSSLCNEWSEVAKADGTLKTDCNPWIPGGPESNRVIMIPIVTGLWGTGGAHVVNIVGFAVFFLEEFNASNCSGSNCDIKGRFLYTQMSSAGSGVGQLDPDSLVTVAKMVK